MSHGGLVSLKQCVHRHLGFLGRAPAYPRRVRSSRLKVSQRASHPTLTTGMQATTGHSRARSVFVSWPQLSFVSSSNEHHSRHAYAVLIPRNEPPKPGPGATRVIGQACRSALISGDGDCLEDQTTVPMTPARPEESRCCGDKSRLRQLELVIGILFGVWNNLSTVLNAVSVGQKGLTTFSVLMIFFLFFPGFITSVAFLVLHFLGHRRFGRLPPGRVGLYFVLLLTCYPFVPTLL